MYLRAGSAGELGKERGMEQIGFWNKVTAHPAYDSFWSDQAVDKILAKEPLTVPTMLVHSLWDQEDIYGAMAVYKAIEAGQPDAAKKNLYLSLGPWYHGQEIEEGSNLGAIKFGSDTAYWWREQVLAPFLAHYLKDDAPAMNVAPVRCMRRARIAGSICRRGRWAANRVASPSLRRCIWRRMASWDSARLRRRVLTPMFPIQPSRCRFVRGPFCRWATCRRLPGRAGWWTISGSFPGGRMC
jgi:hypothetical protein